LGNIITNSLQAKQTAALAAAQSQTNTLGHKKRDTSSLFQKLVNTNNKN
jgi:hypothetical protein